MTLQKAIRETAEDIHTLRGKHPLIDLLCNAADKLDEQEKRIQKLEHDAIGLWMLLDDIDTAGDVAKADDVLYRAIAERTHKRRFDPRFDWMLEQMK